MDVIKDKIYPLIDEELKAEVDRFGLNHSNHESFAVVREKIDEVSEDLVRLEHWSRQIWEATKNNENAAHIRDLYEEMYKTAIDTAVEAIQVAAMARKGIMSNINFTKKSKHDLAITKAIEAIQATRAAGLGVQKHAASSESDTGVSLCIQIQ